MLQELKFALKDKEVQTKLISIGVAIATFAIMIPMVNKLEKDANIKYVKNMRNK